MRLVTSSLLVVGATLLFSSCSLLKTNDPSLDTTAESAPTESPTSNFDGQQLMTAFKSGASLSCTMTNTADGSTVTFVTKDKKNRSTTTSPESPGTTSYMINDGQYMYLWTSDQKSGFKTRIPTEAELEANKAQLDTLRAQVPDFTDATVQQEYVDKGYSMNCEPATIADSEFVPPTTIQFQDMSAMMQKAMEGLPKTMEIPSDQ